MSFTQRHLFKGQPIEAITNRQAKFLLSQRHPFEERKSENYWGNLAFAA